MGLRPIRGARARWRRCTHCDSRFVRPSRRAAPWPWRRLELTLFRCETCFKLFLLPKRLLPRGEG